jgi:hypothetical protein
VFPQQISLTCAKGIIVEGNWLEMGVLKHYSGGIWHRKTISQKPEQTTSSTTPDMGKVGSMCEFHVNGNKAGILIGLIKIHKKTGKKFRINN